MEQLPGPDERPAKVGGAVGDVAPLSQNLLYVLSVRRDMCGIIAHLYLGICKESVKM
jgi:hypothetical protein